MLPTKTTRDGGLDDMLKDGTGFGVGQPAVARVRRDVPRAAARFKEQQLSDQRNFTARQRRRGAEAWIDERARLAAKVGQGERELVLSMARSAGERRSCRGKKRHRGLPEPETRVLEIMGPEDSPWAVRSISHLSQRSTRLHAKASRQTQVLAQCRYLQRGVGVAGQSGSMPAGTQGISRYLSLPWVVATVASHCTELLVGTLC